MTDVSDKVGCKIRSGRASDAPALATLRYALRSTTGVATEPRDEFIKRCTEWMNEHLKAESRWQCWVAESDDCLIGCLWIQLVEKIPNPRAEPEYHAYLTNFFIYEYARGKGIGSQLLSTAIAWCETNEVDAVILWPTQRSRSLYERRGFAVREDLMELVIGNVR
ncbi:MAG: N-acetyltransferase family protein [Pyrinomonadaceae bacterium]